MSFHLLVLTHFFTLYRKIKPWAGELTKHAKCLPHPYEYPRNYLKSQVECKSTWFPGVREPKTRGPRPS